MPSQIFAARSGTTQVAEISDGLSERFMAGGPTHAHVAPPSIRSGHSAASVVDVSVLETFTVSTEQKVVSVLPVMANGTYRFDRGGPFTPYVGGGIGFAFVEADLYRPGAPSGDTALAYQGVAGADYEISDKISVGLRYNYLATMGRFHGGTEPAVTAHSVSAIARFVP